MANFVKKKLILEFEYNTEGCDFEALRLYIESDLNKKTFANISSLARCATLTEYIEPVKPKNKQPDNRRFDRFNKRH